MAEHSTPRISVNKLAEYIVKRGARQRQILRDQKFPQDFKGMYYREASEAISTCLASDLENISVLERAIRVLEQMTPDKIGTQRRIASNVDAIETFMAMLDDVDFMGGAPELGSHQAQKLVLRNVDISVRPEIILRATGKSGSSLIGAVKIHFPRTFPLNEEASGYASAILQEYCKSCFVADEDVSGSHCFVIDIGSQSVYPGVKSTKNRIRDVTAECRNIHDLWPRITENE